MRRFKRFAFLFALVVFAFISLEATRADAKCADAVTAQSVLYATDREPVDGSPLYNGERGIGPNRVPIESYGVISSPVSRETLVKCDSKQDFFDAVRRQFDPDSPKALVYVHGYYTSFKTAVEAALTMRKGLGFHGPIIAYSWPSRYTSRLTYLNDQANADWSFSHFTDLISKMQQQFPGMPLSFATHSLGARFAEGGIQFIRHSPCKECFGRALLFAPDVDGHTVFRELSGLGLCPGNPASQPTASAPVTLYASNNDLALRQSQRISGHQRAGQAGSELILCHGVDTIDVSHFNGADRVGHNYHIDPEIVRDAAAALAGTPPTAPARKLRTVDRQGAQYYELHNL